MTTESNLGPSQREVREVTTLVKLAYKTFTEGKPMKTSTWSMVSKGISRLLKNKEIVV